MKIAILGYGQVGKALEEIYLKSPFGQPLIKDLDRNDYEDIKELDILNVCIPFDENFKKIVIDEINRLSVKLTIIHSTVSPYTTKDIQYHALPKLMVVYSPVRGKRESLSKSILAFIKYIGSEREKDAKATREHFVQLGISKNKIFMPSVIVEINKLVSDAYYAHCISFTDYANDILQKYKVDFETFKHFNDSYNRGYRRFRMKHVNRPTLNPPMDKKIGRNSLIKNTKILEELFPHEVTKQILKYE